MHDFSGQFDYFLDFLAGAIRANRSFEWMNLKFNNKM